MNIDYLPPQGEFVALIAANSTKSIPQVFVAKVLRLPHDGKTAYLKEFSELKVGKFKLKEGKSYKEAVNSFIYQIANVYSHFNTTYELRMSKNGHCYFSVKILKIENDDLN